MFPQLQRKANDREHHNFVIIYLINITDLFKLFNDAHIECGVQYTSCVSLRTEQRFICSQHNRH